MFQMEQTTNFRAGIRVVGVGGCGGNAVNTMIEEGLEGVEFWVVNTDQQALDLSKAQEKVRIGETITKGLGAGGDPEIGRRAAEEDVEKLRRAVEGVEMIFITAGMGGGTGTGASPVIAKLAKEKGVLTVGVVTKPFTFEGKRRMRNADLGIRELKKYVDTLLVIPNDKLLTQKNILLFQALAKTSNDVLVKAVKGISDLVIKPGFVNRDFADLRAVMAKKGKAIMGIGTGKGENAAIEAAQAAINSPFLEDVSIGDAQSVLVNITVNPENFYIEDFHEAMNLIQEHVSENTEIFMGVVFEPIDEVRITLIATGIPDEYGGIKDFELEEEPVFRKETRFRVDLETPAFMRRQFD